MSPHQRVSSAELTTHAAALSAAVGRPIIATDLVADEIAPKKQLGKRVRRALARTFSETCLYCDRRGTTDRDADGRKWHPDHFIPRSRYGSNHPSNIVLACHFCNNEKWDSLWLPGRLTPSNELAAFREKVNIREAGRAAAKAKRNADSALKSSANASKRAERDPLGRHGGGCGGSSLRRLASGDEDTDTATSV
jgi:5-methylcytosine-specific restriction endonuclease McrA